MDKPPTKTKPSAEAEEAPDELDADAQERIERLRQLADDYAAAFHRKPNPEDLRMARKLREMSREDLLLPETKLIPDGDGFRVREIPDRFIRVSGKAINEALKTPHRNTWERQTWVNLIPIVIKRSRRKDPRSSADRETRRPLGSDQGWTCCPDSTGSETGAGDSAGSLKGPADAQPSKSTGISTGIEEGSQGKPFPPRF